MVINITVGYMVSFFDFRGFSANVMTLAPLSYAENARNTTASKNNTLLRNSKSQKSNMLEKGVPNCLQ